MNLAHPAAARSVPALFSVSLSALLCSLAMFTGCSSGGAQGPKTRPPPQVIVQQPQRRDVPVEAKAPIDLRPLQTVEIGSKQLGYLSAVLVERGDRVRRGQLVALVRPSDLPDQLRSAQSGLAQAQAALTLARSNRGRLGELAPSGVVSMQEVEQSRTALSQAEAQEATAQAQLAAIATRLGETRIDSPIDGVVMSRRLDPGALVGPSSASLLTVARIDRLKVLMPIRERDSGNLAIGQEAIVRLDARPGETHAAQIVRMAPGFDPVTRTLDVELHLDNPEGKLRPGMYGRAALRVALHPQTLVLPESAILGGSGNLADDEHGEDSAPAGRAAPQPAAPGRARFVYLVDAQNRVRKRPVGLGYDGGNWIEVRSGLSDGDQVITAGADVVTEGMEVRPVRDQNVYTGTRPTPKTGEASPAGGAHVAH